MRKRLEQILDEKVRPSLHLHGGDIEVLSVEDGVMRFRYLGQCSGCPSATLTTEQLVEEEVRAAMPEIKRVELVQEVSQEMLDQLHEILRRRHEGE